jgi:cyclopropane fatty-acyl-phospholipid synthase-like methyltransferase
VLLRDQIVALHAFPMRKLRPDGMEASSERTEILEQTRQFFNKPRNSARSLPPVARFAFDQVIKLLPKGTAGQTALDLGCHWGRVSAWLADSYGKVIGVDFADKAIESAERRDNIEYCCLDLNTSAGQLREFGLVDLIVAVAVFEMIGSPAALCQHLAAVAKPSCKVVAVIPNRRSVNYWSLRSALWISRNLLRHERHIYNNGCRIDQLKRCFVASGFTVRESGSIVGVPGYLAGLLPSVVQTFLLKFDRLFIRLFGGSYHWIYCQFQAEE